MGPLSYRDSHLLWDPCLNVTVNNCGTPVIMRQSTIVGPLSYRDSRLLWDPCLNATVNYCGSPVPCPKTTVSVKMILYAMMYIPYVQVRKRMCVELRYVEPHGGLIICVVVDV